MERLDKLSSGIMSQNTGKYKDYPLVASLTATDCIASLSDMSQALFDVLWQTLVHLGPVIRQEQEQSLTKSHSQDFLLGVPLSIAPPTSALR